MNDRALPVIQECSEERIEEGSSSSSKEDLSLYASSSEEVHHSEPAELFHRFVTRKCVLLTFTVLACIACVVGVTIQLNAYDVTGNQSSEAKPRVSSFIQRTESLIENELDVFRKDQFQQKVMSNHFPKDRTLETIRLPEYTTEELKPFSSSDDPVANAQPIFWIANSQSSGGATALKHILTYCMNLVISSDATYDDDKEEKADSSNVLIFNTADKLGHYANANTETREGLLRAQEMAVVESEVVHVISTPFLAEASALFRNRRRTGRIFTLLQNPVDQAYANFLEYKTQQQAPDDITISEYTAQNNQGGNGIVVSNPLTRALINATSDELLDYDQVLIAKRMLLEQILVGLVEQLDVSVHMFGSYFGWDIQKHDAACLSNFEATAATQNDHPLTESDRRHLANFHSADMELYELGKTMFEHHRGRYSSTSSTHV